MGRIFTQWFLTVFVPHTQVIKIKCLCKCNNLTKITHWVTLNEGIYSGLIALLQYNRMSLYNPAFSQVKAETKFRAMRCVSRIQHGFADLKMGRCGCQTDEDLTPTARKTEFF